VILELNETRLEVVVILYTTLFESSFENEKFLFELSLRIWGVKMTPFVFGARYACALRAIFLYKGKAPAMLGGS